MFKNRPLFEKESMKNIDIWTIFIILDILKISDKYFNEDFANIIQK